MFLAGYLVLWTGFSLSATLAQWGLHSLALIFSHDGQHQSLARRFIAHNCRCLPMDAAQARLLEALPIAAAILVDVLAGWYCWGFPHGCTSRNLLLGLLLALNGGSVRSRRDESRLDCDAQPIRAGGENDSKGIFAGQGRRGSLSDLGRLVDVFGWSIGD